MVVAAAAVVALALAVPLLVEARRLSVLPLVMAVAASMVAPMAVAAVAAAEVAAAGNAASAAPARPPRYSSWTGCR